MRMKPWAGLTTALKNTEMIIPSHQTLRTREDRSVSAYVLARTSRSAGTARSATHAGNRGDSFEVALTWATYTDKFSISLKQMDNNIFAFDEAFAQQILNASINLHEAIETGAINHLMTARSTGSNTLKGATFNATPDAVEVSLANSDRFWQIIKSTMRQNYFTGALDVIADSIKYMDAERLGAQGTGNSTNQGYQFQGLNIIESVELTDADYANGCALVMPSGSFGVLPWIPKQNRTGWGDFNSYVGGYGSIADPLGTGLEFAVHGYAARNDASASNGDVQDVLLEFELSVDLAFQTSPLSTAGRSVVYEYGQLAV